MQGSVAQIGCQTDLPFPWKDSSHGFSDGYTERREAVQHGYTDLKLGELTVKVPRHEAQTQQFDTVHLCLDAAPAVIPAPSIARQAHPKDAAERGRQIVRPKRFDARRASLRAIAPGVPSFHGLAFLRGGMMAAAPRAALLVHVNMHCRAVDGVVALAGVESAVRCPATVCLQTVRGGGDAGDLLVGRDLVEKLGQ